MPLVATPALVLHSFKYGETSKIVRLSTRDFGVLSAIAKGASRPKSKFGAQLQVLSDGVAQLYMKPTRDLQTLAGFEVAAARGELGRDLRRYAAAVALAELVLRFSPEEPDPDAYDRLVYELDRLTVAPADELDATALAALWGVVRTLGFAPSIDGCARDGRPLPVGTCGFSVQDGGFVCNPCAALVNTSRLTAGDRATLEQFVTGNSDVPPLSSRHAAAHRRLFSRFVQRHVAEGRELKALTFWEDTA